MIKKILTYPKDKDILTQKSIDVEDVKSEEVQSIIQDLKDTVMATKGAGISAIQLGKPLKICVINWDGIHVLINPVVTRSRGQHELQEGCLSVPGLFVKNVRPQKVWISALDENGNEIEYAEGGNGSYIALHELEHFEGKCSLFAAYDALMSAKKEEDSNVQEN